MQTLANTGALKFHDETETVRTEAAKLKADGVDIIIVLSHSGLDVDEEIARNCGPDVDVIVGGHTHTFLFTGSNLPGPETPAGEYPTLVTQDSGHVVYVVQASAYTKYLGDITFYFDEQGEVLSYEGAPIYLDSSVEPGEQRGGGRNQSWRGEGGSRIVRGLFHKSSRANKVGLVCPSVKPRRLSSPHNGCRSAWSRCCFHIHRID